MIYLILNFLSGMSLDLVIRRAITEQNLPRLVFADRKVPGSLGPTAYSCRGRTPFGGSQTCSFEEDKTMASKAYRRAERGDCSSWSKTEEQPCLKKEVSPVWFSTYSSFCVLPVIRAVCSWWKCLAIQLLYKIFKKNNSVFPHPENSVDPSDFQPPEMLLYVHDELCIKFNLAYKRKF